MKSNRPRGNVAEAVYQVLKKFLTSRLAPRLNHILLLALKLSGKRDLQISVYSSEIVRIADLFRYDTYP